MKVAKNSLKSGIEMERGKIWLEKLLVSNSVTWTNKNEQHK